MLVCLLAGIAIRVTLIQRGDALSGDAGLRYDPIARNLASGHGFSKSKQAPYLPDDFDQPVYPLFIAAIYRLFDYSVSAVRLIQAAIELAILWLAWRITILLGLPRKVGISAVLIGLICPFIPLFAGRLLTEVVATFLLALTAFLLLTARERGGWWWAAAGGSAATGLLTRPDLLISLGLMIAAALLQVTVDSGLKVALKPAAFLGISIILMMMPWCYRNYVTFGLFRPLGGVTAQTSLSYVKWLGTWVDDPRYQQDYWWRVWDRGKAISFPADKLTAEQAEAAGRALQIAGAQGSFEGEPDRILNEAYRLALRNDPLKIAVLLPVKRTVMAWLRMPGYLENALMKYVAYAFWLPFLVLSALGLAVSFRENKTAFLFLGAWVAGRTVLPIISVLAIEPRYQIEALPACFIASAFAAISIIKPIKKRMSANMIA